MYIYNTTFFIHESRLPEVLHWLKTRFIPETQRDNLLRQPRMFRAITSTASDEMSYAVQFEADSLADINQWRATIEPPLMQEMNFTFLTAVSTFSTIMEIENIDDRPMTETRPTQKIAPAATIFAPNSCICQKKAVPLQPITDEICKNK